MFEKTESRDTGNIGHTRHRTNTNKTQKYNTPPKTTKLSSTDPTKNRGVIKKELLIFHKHLGSHMFLGVLLASFSYQLFYYITDY